MSGSVVAVIDLRIWQVAGVNVRVGMQAGGRSPRCGLRSYPDSRKGRPSPRPHSATLGARPLPRHVPSDGHGPVPPVPRRAALRRVHPRPRPAAVTYGNRTQATVLLFTFLLHWSLLANTICVPGVNRLYECQ